MKIIVDSGCDLTKELQNKMNITTVPLNLIVGETEFIDDENLDIDEYIKAMSDYKGTPKTSAPSPQIYADAYEGDESVFVVTLSSKLSGSFNSASLGRDMALEINKDKFIYIIDSKSASVGETVIAQKLFDLINEGLSEENIVTEINKFMSQQQTYLILDSYDTLVKNGRMSATIAKLASMLSIKLVCCAKNGEIDLSDKARGYNNAVKKLIKTITLEALDFENRILSISHVNALEKAIDFKNEIKKAINFKDIFIVEASGLCSTYASVGGIVISY